MHRSPCRARVARFSTTACSRAFAVASILPWLAAPSAAVADDSIVAVDAATFVARFEADNPRLAATDAELDAQRADVTDAGMLPNPSLSFEREELFPDAGSAAEQTIALGWSLDLSGRRSRNVTAARGRARAAGERGERAKLLVLADALETFYDCAHARQRLAVLREGREPLARMVAAVERRAEAGDVAGYDATRLQLELAAYDQRVAEAQAELTAARRSLGGAIGTPAVLVDADDELALPTVPAEPAALVDDALAERGDYRATALEESSAAAALAAANRGWVPSLDLGVGLKTAADGVEDATGYYAMIGVELPIFTRGQADAERARGQQRAARAHRSALEREISTQVRVAHERLAAAVDQARTFRTAQLERSASLVERAEAVYQGGEGSVVELLDAHRTSVEVRLRYLVLLRRAKRAALSLQLALGRRPELGAR